MKSAPRTVKTPVKMATSAATQRHPPVSPRNPPICHVSSARNVNEATHNRTDSRSEKRCGSKDGHAQTSLSSVKDIRYGTASLHRQRRDPYKQRGQLTLVRGLDPAVPARNRRMIKVQMFCEAITPPLKMVKRM